MASFCLLPINKPSDQPSCHPPIPPSSPIPSSPTQAQTPSARFRLLAAIEPTSSVAERRGTPVQALDLALLGARFRCLSKEDAELGLEVTLSTPLPLSSDQAQVPGKRQDSVPGGMSAPQSGSTATALPPVDQSFMRWSRTASTVFSEAPSTFYYNAKRSTGRYSDATPSVVPVPIAETSTHNPHNMSHPPTPSPSLRPEVMSRRESTNSAGTFGSRQRRWSALHPAVSPETSPSYLQPGEAQIDDIPHPGPGGTSPRPQLRRPLSMSSTSDSTFSGQLHGDRVHIGRSNISGAMFPSPTLRRPTHKTPESTADITAHLLKASGKNESRIVPRLSPIKPAPSVGTPMGEVEEEEGGDACFSTDRRKISKLDQILGEGAETARVLMEFDKKAIRDAVQLPETTPLNLPPRHRSSASDPTASSIPILPPSPSSNVPRGYRADPFSSHNRSDSVDSLPSSLHPSITDSTHTTARLLPNQTPTSPPPMPRRPTDKELVKMHAVPKPEARNDLTPEQRAVLIRRTRKIEHLLGEPLGEINVGQHIVRPSTASSVRHTSFEDTWDLSPTSASGMRIPEYDRPDCRPRIVKASEKLPVPSAKKGTSVAQKAMAALGLGDNKKEEEDLRVYVSREQTVTETVQRNYRAEKISRNRGQEVPGSPEEDDWDDEEGGDSARRVRRQQVAKLNRLLGVQIPASALQSGPIDTTDLSPDTPIKRPSPPHAQSSSDISFISFDEETPSPSWRKRMRSAVNNAMDKDKGRDKDKEREPGSSFWDGALNASVTDNKPKKWTPPRDLSFGNRAEMEGSFMDLKDKKGSSGFTERVSARKNAAIAR